MGSKNGACPQNGAFERWRELQPLPLLSKGPTPLLLLGEEHVSTASRLTGCLCWTYLRDARQTFKLNSSKKSLPLAVTYSNIPHWKRSLDKRRASDFQLSENDGGSRGVIVIVVGNGYDDTSSNPGRDWLHFTLGKVWIQLFSLQLWVNSRTDWVLQPWWSN